MFVPCDIDISTLYRYIKKKKNNECSTIGYVKPKLMFTQEAEDKLASYLFKYSDRYFRLLPMEVRKLAYQCAVILEIKNIPPYWHENNMARPDWFQNIMRRNHRFYTIIKNTRSNITKSSNILQ